MTATANVPAPAASATAKEERMVRAYKRGKCVRSLFVAPPRSAKSTLGNWLASVLSGSREAAFAAGGGDTCDQHTQGPQVWEMLSQFGFGTALGESGKQLFVIDDKGFVSAAGLRSVLAGRVGAGEVLDPEQATKYAAMLSRPPNIDMMPTVAIVPIRASALLDPETEANARYLRQVREILGVLAHFNPSSDGTGRAYQVQAIPVITCIDKLSSFIDLGPECLRREPGSAGAAAMQAVENAVIAAGLDASAAIYLGWLHLSPAGGEYDASDARVAAVWQLLERVVRFGTSGAEQARLAGWDLTAASNASGAS